MFLILILLSLLLLLQAFELRKKVRQIKIITTAPTAPFQTYQFFNQENIVLTCEQQSAVAHFMTTHGFTACDLLSDRMPSRMAMEVAALFSVQGLRENRFSPAFTAGSTIVIAEDLARRAGLVSKGAYSYAELVAIAVHLKNFTLDSMATAILPGLPLAKRSLAQNLEALQHLPWKVVSVVLGIRLLLLLVILLGLITSPLFGAIAFLANAVQPLLIFTGGPLQPKGLRLYSVRCFFADLLYLSRLFFCKMTDASNTLAEQKMRAEYELLAHDQGSFFEARRSDCPHCTATKLKTFMRCGDHIQGKPGLFTLDECLSCHLIFQNPRLNSTGLNYYYKDLYDGLGKETAAIAFASSTKEYLGRAALVARFTHPQNWLDVGTGHGHFCVVAKDILGDTCFDGLDLNDGVSEAERWGWIHRGYRGQFPALADSLAGQYDVVSMQHYLEHVTEPRKELAAAYKALKTKGYLLIELPNPECKLSRFLKGFSTIWLQPQHLQFFTKDALIQQLKTDGFDIIACEVRAAHQNVELFGAVYILVNRLAPSPFLPWNKSSHLRIARYLCVLTLCMPLFLLGRWLGKIQPYFLRSDAWSTAFRVLAQKR